MTSLRATTTFKAGTDRSSATRADIVTEFAYLADIDPGGWAPVSIVKTVARKQYPSLMKRLVNGAQGKTSLFLKKVDALRWGVAYPQ